MADTLKFKTGVLKGRPLESANLPYHIKMWRGEEVAQFSNGSMARFYRETISEGSEMEWCEPPIPPVDATEKTFFEEVEETTTHATECYQKTLAPIVKSIQPRRTIGAFRGHDGSRAKHACDPVYCILEDGRQTTNFDRNTVGSGLREYLWLYEKFREFGRGWFAAVLEARAIYFL